MNAYKLMLLVGLCFVFSTLGMNVAAFAQSQEPKMPDFLELAEKEADRLQDLLDLEDWQTFYVDSTLKHDYVAMSGELMDLQMSKVTNTNMYIAVQDKWMEAIDASYRKIFNEEQWAAYLKSGAARQQKARAKRMEANK